MLFPGNPNSRFSVFSSFPSQINSSIQNNFNLSWFLYGDTKVDVNPLVSQKKHRGEILQKKLREFFPWQSVEALFCFALLSEKINQVEYG